jgi:hypothetical protein
VEQFEMANRWQKVDELLNRAMHLKPMQFGIEFPHPVLVASQIRGGRLVKQDMTDPSPPRRVQRPARPGVGPSTMVHVPTAHVAGAVTDPELLHDRSPSVERFLEITRAKSVEKLIWFTVGRRSTCDVFLNDFTVSKLHAKIRYDGKLTTYHLEDCGSSNGTFINGIRVEKGQLVPLQNNDIVGFGRLDLTYLTPAGFYRYLTETT